MITDLGGFVASTYQRGIRFVNIPTSLLAQVDASVGGKTGINHADLKNLVGCFAQAEMTLIHPAFLQSLPLRERRAGYAEMLKHGLIVGGQHWKDICAYQPENLPSLDLIEASVAVKQAIVKADFTELGLRKTLNLGHTLGHAFESFSLHRHSNPMLHGEAVALGLYWELELAKELGLLASDTAQEIQALLQKHFTWPSFEAEALGELLQYCYGDKKNQNGQLNMVLLEDLGKVNYAVPVEEEFLVNVLRKALKK
jgi:3-dehydroquinate synthase